MSTKIAQPDCLCPNCNRTLDKPEVHDVMRKTVRAFHAAVRANGVTPAEALMVASFIAAGLADDIFNTFMPDDAQQSDEARENYAETFLGLVVSHVEKTMGVSFEGNEDDDYDEDEFHGGPEPDELEIFAALNTRH